MNDPDTALMPADESGGRPTTLTLLQTAVARGMQPDQLEKLMDLHERDQQRQAKDAFCRALTEFQAECPLIVKDRKADRFKFASYDDVMKAVGPVLARHRLAVSFGTEVSGAALKIVCTVRHGTHADQTSHVVPLPAEMRVNDTQKFGAALSYAKRYALCAALNIVVTDEDSDAVALDYITSDQVAEIEELVREKGANLNRFLEFAGAESIDKIHGARFNEVIDALRRKPAVKGGAR